MAVKSAFIGEVLIFNNNLALLQNMGEVIETAHVTRSSSGSPAFSSRFRS